jgi:ribonucleoside-diphosphate reductase alpha chain
MSFSKNALTIMKKLYLKRDKNGKLIEKTPEETFQRVAAFVASAEKENDKKEALKKEFFDLMLKQKFMFSSPTLFNAGSDFPLSSSCFVGNLEDSMASIMKAATDTAMTFKAGAGMGLNFGNLRSKGSPVGRGGTSSGPVSFMRLFDEVGEAVKSGGVRRAAFMAMMDVAHPDIEEFISSKDYVASLKRENPDQNIPDNLLEMLTQNIAEGLSSSISQKEIVEMIVSNIRKELFEPLSNMNISVAVTDEFMRAVKEDKDFALKSEKGPGKKVIARELFHKIALSAWRTADPGVWFVDRANEFDTVPSLGRILSTNPCGEQSLHSYTSCNLGSINLVQFINKSNKFDEAEFRKVVRVSTRALDDIIDVAEFPTEEFKTNTRRIRPIGLGFTGLAEAMYKLRIPYNSEEGYAFAANAARMMTQESILASIDLAEEKGAFPLFEENKEALIETARSYFEEESEKKEIEEAIRKNGIRNSNWTTLAPTGTISLILDAYTYSMEPQFALAYHKNLIDGGTLVYVDPEFEKASGANKEIIQKVIENGGSCQNIPEVPETLQKVFVVAHDISYEDRIQMQSALQKNISNSISSTINLPGHITIEEIEKIYLKAWELGLKGITIYRDGAKSFQPMTAKQQKPAGAKLETKEPLKNWNRPKTLKAEIFKTKTGSGTLYTSVGLDECGNPIEIFINISKHGSDVSAFSEALGRVVSIALQSGVPVDKIADTIIGIMGDSSAWDNGKLIKSVPDAVGRVLKEYAERLCAAPAEQTLFEKEKTSEKKSSKIPGALICPNCGEKAYVKTEDCNSCLSCGFSKCG